MASPPVTREACDSPRYPGAAGTGRCTQRPQNQKGKRPPERAQASSVWLKRHMFGTWPAAMRQICWQSSNQPGTLSNPTCLQQNSASGQTDVWEGHTFTQIVLPPLCNEDGLLLPAASGPWIGEAARSTLAERCMRTWPSPVCICLELLQQEDHFIYHVPSCVRVQAAAWVYCCTSCKSSFIMPACRGFDGFSRCGYNLLCAFMNCLLLIFKAC